MQGLIALDIGTTSMRALLFDSEGQVLHIDQRENSPAVFSDGRVEQDAYSWANLLPSLLKNCADIAKTKHIIVQAIVVTAQRSSVIPISGDGAPLFPAIMWQDRRTVSLVNEMNDAQSMVYRKTGLRISPVYSAIKMSWFARYAPEIWQKTHKMIGIQDWVLYHLTGKLVTDHTFASRTNLFNLTKQCWDRELLELFGIPENYLCDLVMPGSIVGGLSDLLAKESGLREGVPVVSAGGDQQCAALGLGLFSSGQAICNTGTGSFLITHSDQAVFDPDMRLACNMSALPGNHYIVEAAVQTSGAVLKWFAELLMNQNLPGQDLFKALDQEAFAVPPGANDLIFLPHFKGGGAPFWDLNAKGLWYGLTLGTTRGEMVRAILEGIAIELGNGLDALEKLVGKIDRVTVSGGMSKSPLFNQIQCDIFNRPVSRLAHEEATAFGAWLVGMVACGIDSGYESAFSRVMQNNPLPTQYQVLSDSQFAYSKLRQRAHCLYKMSCEARQSF